MSRADAASDGAIREARPDDLPRYAVIERAAATLYAPWGLDGVFESTPTEPERVARAIAEHDLIVAADPQDVMIGYALVGMEGTDLHLEELAVEPAHGRRGHGTALLCATIALGRSRGARRITLVTLDFVPFGKAFYERCGFAVLAPTALSPQLRELAPPDARDGRVAMALSLSG